MKDRLGVLDGLRGIAILQVLWYHVWLTGSLPLPPWLEFIPATGLYGVHLFFFLSGFVIIYPFVRARAAGQPEPTWTHFAWRRFIKIVPSYVLSIVVAYAIGFAAFERLSTHTTIFEELATHALFIHTWWPSTAGSINTVLWTLGIEVQFYAVFPLVWWCFKRRPAMTGIGLVAFSWILRIALRHVTAGWFLINLPGYLDVFGCGMLCAWFFVLFGHRARGGRYSRVMPVVALFGSVLMIVTLVWHFEGHGSIIVAGVPIVQTATVLGLSYVLLALGALCSPRPWATLLANPLLRFCAVISYNLYLYNWMVLHELQWRFTFHYGDYLWKLRFTIIGTAVSVLVGAIVTYAVERPLLRLPDPHPARRVRPAPGNLG